MRIRTLLSCSVIACALAPAPREGCAVRGAAPRTDVALAQAACARARQRFATAIGPPPAGTIVLSDDNGLTTWTERDRWTLTWPTTARLREGARGTPAATAFLTQQWEDVLPHEIGHIMLGAWLYSPGRPLAGNYATYLPDWVDEAVAIAMEPEDTRRLRLTQARAFRAPRLADLLASSYPRPVGAPDAFSTTTVISHPCEGPCARERPDETRVITSRVYRDGRTTVDTTWSAGDHRLDADPVTRFYTLSYALWRYIEARGGRPAIETLLTRLRRTPDDRSAVVGLPGLAPTLRQIERDWHEWMDVDQSPD
jgi:hypothetical protein